MEWCFIGQVDGAESCSKMYWGCWGSRPAGLMGGGEVAVTSRWPLGVSPSWPSGLEGVVRHLVVVRLLRVVLSVKWWL